MIDLSLPTADLARLFGFAQRFKENSAAENDESGEPVESAGPGLGGRIKSIARAIAWQEFDHPRGPLPAERHSVGPFDEPGRSVRDQSSRVKRSLKRGVASQLGALTSIAANDRSIRVLVSRGNRVLNWATADLPRGVVDDGVVRDPRRFTRALETVITSLHEGSHLAHCKVGLIVSGRNSVQGRFVLLDTGEEDIEPAVLSLAAERMAITPTDVMLDWDAQPLELDEDQDGPSPSRAQDDDEDPGDPFEVYALGMFRNVLDSNLRPIRQAGMKTVSVAPKALALAASVSEESAIVVDIEHDNISVVIVKAGLPEVVRDMRSADDVTVDQFGRALSAHIERAVEYHDMLNPGETIGPETPVFLTGRERDTERARHQLIQRRYNVVPMADSLMAPEGMPLGEMASNIGVAVLRGRKPWQKSTTEDIERPDFHFVPAEYQPRALPLKPVAATAAAAVFAAGLAAGYGQVSDVRSQTSAAQAELANLDRQLDLKSDRLRQLVRDQALVEAVRSDAEDVLAASEVIRDRDGGFAANLDTIAGLVPEGVTLEEVDDDGHLVTVNAKAPTYDQLLDFTRLLETAEGVLDVRVENIGSATMGSVSAVQELYGLFPDLLPEAQDGDDPAEAFDPASLVPVSMPTLTLELTR